MIPYFLMSPDRLAQFGDDIQPFFIISKCIGSHDKLRSLWILEIFMNLYLSIFLTFSRKKYVPCWPDAKPICTAVMDSRQSSDILLVLFFPLDVTTYIFPFTGIRQDSYQVPMKYSITFMKFSLG